MNLNTPKFHGCFLKIKEQHFIKISTIFKDTLYMRRMFVCVEVLRPSQPNGVSLPNHTFTGQA